MDKSNTPAAQAPESLRVDTSFERGQKAGYDIAKTQAIMLVSKFRDTFRYEMDANAADAATRILSLMLKISPDDALAPKVAPMGLAPQQDT